MVSNGTSGSGRKKEEVRVGYHLKSISGVSKVKRSRGDSTTPPSIESPSKEVRGETRDFDVTKLTIVWSHVGMVVFTYRFILTSKIAVVLSHYPEAKLTYKQGEYVEGKLVSSNSWRMDVFLNAQVKRSSCYFLLQRLALL